MFSLRTVVKTFPLLFLSLLILIATRMQIKGMTVRSIFLLGGIVLFICISNIKKNKNFIQVNDNVPNFFEFYWGGRLG
jgi:hypothetical protein